MRAAFVVLFGLVACRAKGPPSPATLSSYMKRYTVPNDCTRGRLPLGLNLTDTDRQEDEKRGYGNEKYDAFPSACTAPNTLPRFTKFLSYDADAAKICFEMQGGSNDSADSAPNIDELNATWNSMPAWVIAAPKLDHLSGAVERFPTGAATKWELVTESSHRSDYKEVDRIRTEENVIKISEYAPNSSWSIVMCASGFTVKNEDKHVMLVVPSSSYMFWWGSDRPDEMSNTEFDGYYEEYPYRAASVTIWDIVE